MKTGTIAHTRKSGLNGHTRTRHDALKTAAGFLLLPSGAFLGAAAPSNKLNVALIGADGRGRSHYDGLLAENVAAICDVDETHLDFAADTFPNAKRYIDWRAWSCPDRMDPPKNLRKVGN